MTVPLGLDKWEPSTAQRRVRDDVARIFQVEPSALIGRGRRKPLVTYRHIAMWVVHECFPALSYPMIGRLFGGRDHSTVINGIRNVDDARMRDAGLRELTDVLKASYGVQRAGIVMNEAMRLRIAAISGAESDSEAERAAKATAPALPPRAVLPKNDFGDETFAQKGLVAGSRALLAAQLREGMVQ